jgi:GT2 family glycosyltransferase
MLSVIIVTYNAREITLKMLPSLKKSLNYFHKNSGQNFEVLVVDNNSSDGVLDDIKEKYVNQEKFLKVIPNNKNLGFSKANNLAIKHLNSKSTDVLFLNPDVILEEKSIYLTYDFLKKNRDCGLVSCLVLLPNNEIDIDSHRAFPTIWNSFCYFTKLEKFLGKIFPRVFGRYHMLYEDLSKTHEIDACLGAFMMIPRNVGDKVSWFSEEYFLNGEDLDLCYKIKVQQGYKIYFLPETKIHHFKGSSKGTKKISKNFAKVSDKTKNLQINSGIEAMKVFYNKFYAPKNSSIINYLVILGIDFLKRIRLFTKIE